MLQILASRGPSQKLSKPVPNTGFPLRLRTRSQSSVRPVRVGSLPIVSKANLPNPKKSVHKQADTAPATSKCTDARFLTSAERLVTTISREARRKQEKEVIELAFQKSHRVIARRAPCAIIRRILCVSSRVRQAERKRQTDPSPKTRQVIPSKFLFVETPE